MECITPASTRSGAGVTQLSNVAVCSVLVCCRFTRSRKFETACTSKTVYLLSDCTATNYCAAELHLLILCYNHDTIGCEH